MLAQLWCSCEQIRRAQCRLLPASAVLLPLLAARLTSSDLYNGCHHRRCLEVSERVLTGMSSTLGILLPSTSMSWRARLHTAGTMGCILSCSRKTASANTISSRTLPAAQQHQCLTVLVLDFIIVHCTGAGEACRSRPCSSSRASQSGYLVK